ncbi:hypothetical protein P3T25_000114 [Paraburkholderia sp. GAS32]
MNQSVALWLSFGQVARHAKQFTSQMRCLLRAKTTFETGLRRCPMSGRFVELRYPSSGEYDSQSPIALRFGRSNHEATPKQGFKRSNEGRSVHHHRFGQLGHRQIRTTTQRFEDAELRGRDAGLRQMTLIEL